MCVAENCILEKIGVLRDKAFWVESTAHVVDIRFTAPLQPRKVRFSKRIDWVCQAVFYVALEERTSKLYRVRY